MDEDSSKHYILNMTDEHAFSRDINMDLFSKGLEDDGLEDKLKGDKPIAVFDGEGVERMGKCLEKAGAIKVWGKIISKTFPIMYEIHFIGNVDFVEFTKLVYD